MKLTVLIDNNTLIGKFLRGEPGVSYHIEDGDKKILFDVGYSDAFISNARELSVDLSDIDYVVLSHGHLDHTWGLGPLVELYKEKTINAIGADKPRLVAHPLALEARTSDNLGQIGPLLTLEKLSDFFYIELNREPVWLTEKLVFLGEIERTNEFEGKTPVGKLVKDGAKEDDYVIDDTALAYKSADGLVIITGCSHSGICNIIEYAKKVCGEDKIVDILGGFHLRNPSMDLLQRTIEYMRDLQPGSIHACHCTDLRSKITISRVANLKEVGVGLVLEY